MAASDFETASTAAVRLGSACGTSVMSRDVVMRGKLDKQSPFTRLWTSRECVLTSTALRYKSFIGNKHRHVVSVLGESNCHPSVDPPHGCSSSRARRDVKISEINAVSHGTCTQRRAQWPRTPSEHRRFAVCHLHVCASRPPTKRGRRLRLSHHDEAIAHVAGAQGVHIGCVI